MMREKHPAGDHENTGEEFFHGYGERYKKGLEWDTGAEDAACDD